MTGAAETILYVDDSFDDFKAAQHAFRLAGLHGTLEHAPSGAAALERLKQPPRPSLILLDFHMPVMSGPELLSIIKKAPDLKDIPVVMLTHSKDKEGIRACYALGANAYILKSDDFHVLADNIRKLKEYWLDTVELPQVFGSGSSGFSVIENEDFVDPMPEKISSIYLSPDEVYRRIMGAEAQEAESPKEALTVKEVETLTWAARGKSRWEISVILGLSEETVKTRLDKCRHKLGAANTTHAIAIALLQGLLLQDKREKP